VRLCLLPGGFFDFFLICRSAVRIIQRTNQPDFSPVSFQDHDARANRAGVAFSN
jgi:hypothetical protein